MAGIFLKKNWPRPLGAGRGRDLFLGKKRLKTSKNGQNGQDTGLKRVERGMFHFKLVDNMNGHVLRENLSNHTLINILTGIYPSSLYINKISMSVCLFV